MSARGSPKRSPAVVRQRSPVAGTARSHSPTVSGKTPQKHLFLLSLVPIGLFLVMGFILYTISSHEMNKHEKTTYGYSIYRGINIMGEALTYLGVFFATFYLFFLIMNI